MPQEMYDLIAKEYKKCVDTALIRNYSTEPSVFHYLGNVKNKNILDLACGEGTFTRKLKLLEAKEIIGVDISSKMIELAKNEENKHPLGINYHIFDVAKMPKLGDFDIITALFLLHYSKSKQDLFAICQNIYNNLKPGGEFISINLNPDDPLQPLKEYNSTILPVKDLKEGAKIKITLYLENKEICYFYNYHWNKKTYETAFEKAGFKSLEWHKLIVLPEGIKNNGKDFWQKYLEHPGLIIIKARK